MWPAWFHVFILFTGQISGYWPLISRYLCKQKQVYSINLHLFIPSSWLPTHNWCYVKLSYFLTTLQSEETVIWKISVFLKLWLIYISLYTQFTSKDDWCIILQDSCGSLYLKKKSSSTERANSAYCDWTMTEMVWHFQKNLRQVRQGHWYPSHICTLCSFSQKMLFKFFIKKEEGRNS